MVQLCVYVWCMYGCVHVLVCAADAEKLRLMLERSRMTAVAEAAASRATVAGLNKQVIMSIHWQDCWT